jgi:Ca2+-binding EF-hand superfamily protein
MFREADKNNDQLLTKEEVANALQKLHIPTTEAQLNEIFDLYNEDKDAGLNPTEFGRFVQIQQDRLTKLFDTIDLNKDGSLDASEVETVFERTFGTKLGSEGKEKIKKLIAIVDKNDGKYFFPKIQTEY